MAKNKEVITNGFLAFHPFNYKIFTLNNYKNKLEKYNLKN